MQQKQPLTLNTDETKDTSPVTLRPSWVPDRGPIGGTTKNPKPVAASTDNRVTAEPVTVTTPPASVEPVAEPAAAVEPVVPVMDVCGLCDAEYPHDEPHTCKPAKAALPVTAPE